MEDLRISNYSQKIKNNSIINLYCTLYKIHISVMQFIASTALTLAHCLPTVAKILQITRHAGCYLTKSLR